MIDDVVYGLPCLLAPYLLGWGLTALLLPDRFRGYEAWFAPWIGMAQTALVLMAFGSLGTGVRRSWPAAILVAAILLAAAAARGGLRIDGGARVVLPPIGLVFVIASLVLVPLFTRWDGLNTFTLGNNDPFTYVLSAAWFREHGLLSFPRGPLWHATADNNLLIQDPRWLPMLHLSFFSSMLRVDPARLFTSIQTLGFALQLPLVWLLGQRVFGLAGVGLGAGFLLALLNPYPYYIAFHGFMPQVFGTGFFFSFLIVLPAFLEDQRFNLRDAMLLTLLGAGLFASYLELAPFAAFVLAAYAVCTAIRQGSWLHRLGRAVLVAGGVAALSPLQLGRIVGLLRSHLEALSPEGTSRTGWPMEGSYTKMGGLLNVNVAAPRLAIFVALATLTVLGLAALRSRRLLVLVIAAPFLAAAVAAYRADYSYAFFKSWTYIYFWLPLVIGQGIATVAGWCRSASLGRLARSGLAGLLILVTVTVIGSEAWATNRLRARFSSRGQRIPLELATLEPLNRDPAINDIFLSGLDYWESLWAVYYLRDKRIGMTSFNGYVRNETGLAEEGRWRFLLRKEGFHPLITSGHRRVEETLLRTPRFSFGRLEAASEQDLGSVILGHGFYANRRDAREEWAWLGREAELVVRWRGRPSVRLLTIECATPRTQNLRVLTNDQLVGTFVVEAGSRTLHRVALAVVSGENRVVLRSDREPTPVDADPGLSDVQVFSLDLGAAPDGRAPRSGSSR